MKYFWIETEDKNKNPYRINKNRAIDIKLLTKEQFGGLPLWSIVEMDFPEEGFFPDLIDNPFILLSEACIKAVLMYQTDALCKGIKLWDKESGINATYFLTVLDELDCMSEQTQFNSVRNRVLELVLDQEKIGANAVFKIKGYHQKGMVGRLDFVESILRRDARGIRLKAIDII